MTQIQTQICMCIYIYACMYVSICNVSTYVACVHLYMYILYIHIYIYIQIDIDFGTQFVNNGRCVWPLRSRLQGNRKTRRPIQHLAAHSMYKVWVRPNSTCLDWSPQRPCPNGSRGGPSANVVCRMPSMGRE